MLQNQTVLNARYKYLTEFKEHEVDSIILPFH